MATKTWICPTRDFYRKGEFFVKGTEFTLPMGEDPPKGSFEVKPQGGDNVREALKGKPFTGVTDDDTSKSAKAKN